MIPLRAVFEGMGAGVVWNSQDRSVTASRSGRWVRLWIGRRTACLVEDCSRTTVMDVPAELVGNRTFVPLRFVAETLGASVHWNNATRVVTIVSNKTPPSTPPPVTGSPSEISFVSPPGGAVITGPVSLQIRADGVAQEAAEVRYYLLNPDTGKGPMIGRSSNPNAPVPWIPDPAYDGSRVIAAALYDGQGRLLARKDLPIRQQVTPVVTLSGIAPGTQITGRVGLKADVSFLATHLKYELIDPTSGKATLITDAGDPFGEFSWTPSYSDNGQRLLRVTAYDRQGRAHTGADVPVTIQVGRSAVLTGVKDGSTLSRPVTLGISANFPVKTTRYYARERASGNIRLLAEKSGAGNHSWFPGPELTGDFEIWAEITGEDGQTLTTGSVAVKLPGRPVVYLATVGPDQVLAGDVELRAQANVQLKEHHFQLIDPRSGAVKTIASGANAGTTLKWSPTAVDAGDRRLRVTGITMDGRTVQSEELPVRVHVGPLYGPKPVVEKDGFIDFVSGMAVESRRQTHMSAALQIAQAILETGWGQSVPVDKYTGKMSNNLFGIKGTGPAGAVISNTWEEYNGVAYRIDAAFRAYPSVSDSWADHKRLLLTAERYAQFREVMHQPLLGAWALRRAGYATDSRYPLKLIDIMNRYNLYQYDETAP